VANEQLKAALTRAGVEPEQLADRLGVDEKTVRRWLAGRIPYGRHRARIAHALGVHERELWPDAAPPARPSRDGQPELVSAFAHASVEHAPDWSELLEAASERIDLLDFTLADILSVPGVAELLGAKASAGCNVRLLISYQTRARLAEDTPIDQPYPDEEPAAAYEIARSRGHLEPLLALPGIQARKFAAMRFNSIVRGDDEMLVTLHLWGTPSQRAPLLHLRQAEQPALFDQFATHYQAVWDHAAHPIDPEPGLFPDPATHPEHYDSLIFDDIVPDEHQP
jgi:transcriptional regulator with XRE-family HTH domain